MNVSGASKSWKRIGREHIDILHSLSGWDTFRKTIAARYFTDSLYTEEDIHHTLNRLKQKGIVIRETDFLEGSPVHITLDGIVITQDLLVSASELHSMESVIDFNKIRSFVEIGGGYGRMALLLLQRYPHIKYSIVDVPPAINISKKFLEGKFKVEFVSPSDLSSVGDADIFYSSSVMSELDMTKINRYFEYIKNHGRFFYLKDWKIGRHTNSVPFALSIFYRLINRIARLYTGKDTEWIYRKMSAFRVNENTYPTIPGWKELLHKDCDNAESFSPSKGSAARDPLFFEVIWETKPRS